MITVRLLSKMDVPATPLSQHAAGICYTAEVPVLGESKINVQSQLFNTGHHTTIAHEQFTFEIDGLSVSAATFGLHLNHPFYNSDQRSGRFSKKMFLEPDFLEIQHYITTLWPSVHKDQIRDVMAFIMRGIMIYKEHMPQATECMAAQIAAERPMARDAYIVANAPKFAQEQMRMFISTIFPTALDYSADLLTIVSLFQSAWSPEMREVTNKMRDLVVSEQPELSYMFDESHRVSSDWAPVVGDDERILTSPKLKLLSVDDCARLVTPTPEDMHPVDRLHFMPKYMDNYEIEVRSEITISLATMGQDQRHRTIKRSSPKFTGGFYTPWVVTQCVPKDVVQAHLSRWLYLAEVLPPTLAAAIAPYGAMVNYRKSANANALAHEMAKRLCWCSQEEIYNLGLFLREAIVKTHGSDHPLLNFMEPPCWRGSCSEGSRYCGRSVKRYGIHKPEECFTKRLI